MLPDRFAALVNLTGFTAALALYAMLLVMVVRNPDAAMGATFSGPPGGAQPPRTREARRQPLLIATALLGLAWNLGASALYGLLELGLARPPAVAAAVAFAALGFLPAVVVHGSLHPALVERRDRSAGAIVVGGYCLSAVAAALHLAAMERGAELPSPLALRLLVFGFGGVTVLLAVQARRRVTARRALLLAALSVFAVSALHLAQHEALRDSWSLELLGHHASLPLAIAIVYQDYPFALADLFLKRALVMLLVLAGALALFAVASAVLPVQPDPLLTMVFVACGIGLAVLYAPMRRAVDWFIDAIILQRPDYAELGHAVSAAAAQALSPEDVLEAGRSQLAPALTARRARAWRIEGRGPVGIGEGETPDSSQREEVAEAHLEWSVSDHGRRAFANATKTEAVLIVPTAEPPRYALALGDLAGGRRLLSDDLSMLESVAHALARRIDVLRLDHERCAQRVREAEIRQLATEAELRALRAQINPHFLFNALTTLGYLIQTSPSVALEKLVQLTELLRRVLQTKGEFTTLGQELELVRLYLDLERARFEERLRVEVDVPASLRDMPVPTLVLQPLVENAIKHGIAPSATGGLVELRARLDAPDDPRFPSTLRITIRDTGRGARSPGPRQPGIGLQNIERRLQHHYGSDASVRLESRDGEGTVVTILLPAAFAAPGAGAAPDEQRRT